MSFIVTASKPRSFVDRILGRNKPCDIDPFSFAVMDSERIQEKLASGQKARAEEVESHLATMDKLTKFVGGAYNRRPFKPGEFVRLKAGGFYHGKEWPHLVLEVRATPIFWTPEDEQPASSMTWGQNLDMRVLHVNQRGEFHAHWVESWFYEPWDKAVDEILATLDAMGGKPDAAPAVELASLIRQGAAEMAAERPPVGLKALAIWASSADDMNHVERIRLAAAARRTVATLVDGADPTP